jgi:hypothetical protein
MFMQYKQEVVNDDDPFNQNKHLKRDIKPTYKRLYEDASKKKNSNNNSNKKFVEDTVEHHFNRGGLSRNVSQTSILGERNLLG